MSSLKHNQKQYDLYGEIYHKKRQNPANSFWNDCLDSPALESLLKKEVLHKDVLDIGCGSGIFTKKLFDWGANVTGFDNSSTMVQLAKREYPEILFLSSNSIKTHFTPDSFDIITSALVIHYLKNVTPLFKEISRILKKNGFFVFSFHHPMNECLHRKKNNLVQAEPYFHNKPYRWKMAGTMELISYHHTFENIFTALDKTGFQVQRLLEPVPPKSSRKIDPITYQYAKDYPTFCTIKAVKI